jgi:hypothetical protein
MKNTQAPDFLKWIIATLVFFYILYGIVIAVQNLF